MVHNIEARNVNEAFQRAIIYMAANGVEETSRNGKVVVAPEPVCTTYRNPTERVLLSPARDANPFFHLMEALWMLGGRNDLAWPLYFNGGFGAYSDNGVTLRGAYGYRWREWFGYDQLCAIVEELRRHPDSRRAVLAMWDAQGHAGTSADFDLEAAMTGGKDVPCNTHMYFDCRGGRLNATVCCRSNDMIWGAYGANAVHFSVLLEVMAAWVGVPVGELRQFSNNFHIYTDKFPTERWPELMMDAERTNYYQTDTVRPYPLVQKGDVNLWLEDLHNFLQNPAGNEGNYYEPFFDEVAVPMYRAWKTRKEKRGTGLEEAERIIAPDWNMACKGWILRREAVKRNG